MADGTRLGSPDDSLPRGAPGDSAPGDAVEWVPVADTDLTDDTSAGVIEFGGLVPPDRRRRYRMAGAVAIGLAAAVAAVVVTRDGGTPGPRPTAPPSATPIRGADMMVGPVPVDLVRPADERNLPVLDSVWPRAVGEGLARAVPLSASPVTRALMLVQNASPDESRVVVLGADGRWRWLDTVRLADPVDAHGNEQRALDTTSLSPRGTHAAFPQRDAVVVVDLTTARARRYAQAGFHEQVIWLPDGNRLYVASATHTYVLDIRTGRFSPVPYRGMQLVAAPRDGGALELLPAGNGRRAMVRRWGQSGQIDDVVVGVDLPAFGTWSGTGWRAGQLVARASHHDNLVPDAAYLVQTVAVVDVNTGAVRRLLGFAPSPRTADRWQGCCLVLGWLSDDTVLVTAASGQFHGILAWDIRTGDMARVMELLPNTLVALPDLATR